MTGIVIYSCACLFQICMGSPAERQNGSYTGRSFQSHYIVWTQTRNDYDRSRNGVSKQAFSSVDERRRHRTVQCLIRTLKTKMWRYFMAKKTMRYVDMLPDMVYSYNHSVHRSIKTEPVDVTAENEREVWHTLYDHGPVKNVKYKFKIGDQVRISKMKRIFEKGYSPNFSKEIFTISKQIPT